MLRRHDRRNARWCQKEAAPRQRTSWTCTQRWIIEQRWLYQMTDAALLEARHCCIRHHTVVEGCWFTGLELLRPPEPRHRTQSDIFGPR